MPRRAAEGRFARPGRRPILALVWTTVATAALCGCGVSADGVDETAASRQVTSAAARPTPATPSPVGPTSVSPRASSPPALSLGAGFLAFQGPATGWVQTHPGDRRAPAISRAIASQPTALWLTGDDSFGNLADAVRQAQATRRTMVLSLYNIPLRWDGLSDPSPLSLTDYEHWIDQVAAMIGRTRAVVVLEPDALWFYDRLPDDQDRATRMTAMNYAVDALTATATRTRVYLDAGTSSGSVAPDRMAALLVQAGLPDAAGFAVNTSSYAPTASIQAYAHQIRSGLRARGISDPRYVTDTGRNGASSWDNDWCNPRGQRLGRPPRLLRSSDGRDMDLWVKAPGTSDGDCGPPGGGQGTYGGQFLPSVAYAMIGR